MWFDIKLQKTLVDNELNKDLFVKSEHKIVRIVLSDILYIESANEYIRIHLDNNEVITTLMRLKISKCNFQTLFFAGTPFVYCSARQN
jgi:DNA-binding LytR/AlgR family response regulator